MSGKWKKCGKNADSVGEMDETSIFARNAFGWVAKNVGILREMTILEAKNLSVDDIEHVFCKISAPWASNAKIACFWHKTGGKPLKLSGLSMERVGKIGTFLCKFILSALMEILLENAEATSNDVEEIAKILVVRFGLAPRKKDGNAQLHKLLLHLYERKKEANREKRPEAAVVPVEEMALHAGIKRQTMYDYLHRWLDLQILKKTSFVSNGKVVIGYELNGTNLEGAFRKAETTIQNQLDASFKLIEGLQNEIKKEKLRENANAASPSEEHSDQ